jgi:hypothetical protein
MVEKSSAWPLLAPLIGDVVETAEILGQWSELNAAEGFHRPIQRYANAARPGSTRARPATRCGARCASIARAKSGIAPSKTRVIAHLA